MKKPDNKTAQLDSIISSLKRIEDNASVFAELGKISDELSSLNEYIQDGLQNIELQYESFSDSINLLSELIDFQKQVIHNKNSEKTISAIFNFLKNNIQYQYGFVLYKMKEDDPHYDLYSPDGPASQQIKKFVESSNIELLENLFENDELSHIITDTSSFKAQEIQWAILKAKSAIIFPLKARGQLFGIGIFSKDNSAFEMRELSFINLVLGLISLLIYQNFYFVILKSRLIQQAKLIKSTEDLKYSDFFENGPLYVFILDNRHLILHANNTAQNDIKLAGESIIGEDFFDIIPSSNCSLFRNLFSTPQEKPIQIFRSPILKQAGQTGIFEFIVSPMAMKSQSDFVLVIAGDVSENYYKELIDHRNEILDEIDQFSRILVSQFNNLLTTILPNISLLKDSLSGSNSNHQKLDQIEKATQRSANLIQKFLNYDVEANEEKESANINKILNAHVSSMKTKFPDNIRIKLELDPAIKNALLYPMKIRHLFDIIVGNSIIALQNITQPEIQFSTSFIHHKRDGLLPHTSFFLKAGHYIELCIRDNGHGIPEKGLTQVLKPFYSTRIKNEGVGLELFIAYNLVKDMKGHIYLDSQVDRFTAVYVFLPFKEEKAVISPTPIIRKSVLERQPQKATILVVDDEYNIRSMMKEIMEMSGLKVFTAGNGQDGVDIYQRNKKDIDLIVMDMVMPVMDGRAAFNEIRKIDPQQKIFIISGYSQREDLQDMLDNGAVGFLRKPFQVKEIVEKINEILSSKN
jgi:CheY-like chemotaxis protein/signal transduction histidine kinase